MHSAYENVSVATELLENESLPVDATSFCKTLCIPIASYDHSLFQNNKRCTHVSIEVHNSLIIVRVATETSQNDVHKNQCSELDSMGWTQQLP
jgi:hypothetical protein